MSGRPLHGGPDALGVPAWDFSTNANACGPAPMVWRAVQEADVTRYPDPAYTHLCTALAAFHGVAVERIVVAASASEFIVRMAAMVAVRWPRATVFVPSPGYADYARAALAHGLRRVPDAGDARLVWHTEPGSPNGQAQRPPAARADAVLVIDRAYAPLRLEGEAPPLPADAWQLISPNKALGLTGVRAAYAVAPPGAEALVEALGQHASSWPLGAHGVAMLAAWTRDDAQQWLQHSLERLRDWKRQQLALCAVMGWQCEPSVTPFYGVHWADDSLLPRLREHGVKLRDAASLGWPGFVRMSVQPPSAQQALLAAWRRVVSP